MGVDFVFYGSHILFDGYKWFEGGLNFFFAKDSGNLISHSLDVREASVSIRVLFFGDSGLIACFF